MSSWADATEEEPIPPPLPQSHPPSAQCPPVLAPEPRPAVAVPDRPPFCAYVANLPFSATEADVRALFGTLSVQPTGVRLPTDKGSDKHKGFAYCTFQDAPTLLTAIGANGVDVQGRPARVSIADATSNPGRSARPERAAGSFFGAGAKAAAAGPADVAGSWRSNHSAAPPPAVPAAPAAGRGAGRGARGAGRGPAAAPSDKPPPGSASQGAAAAAAQPSRAPGAELAAKLEQAPKAAKGAPAKVAAAPAKPKNVFAMLAASNDDDNSGDDSE